MKRYRIAVLREPSITGALRIARLGAGTGGWSGNPAGNRVRTQHDRAWPMTAAADGRGLVPGSMREGTRTARLGLTIRTALV